MRTSVVVVNTGALIAIALVATLLGCAATVASAPPRVLDDRGAPALLADPPPPPQPTPRASWAPGAWRWDGVRYVWEPGHWVESSADRAGP